MRHLCLPSLKYKRLRGDMIQVFKLINGLDDLNWKDFFTKSRTDITRLSQYNLFIAYSIINRIQFAFGNMAAPMWNKLNETTRSVDTLNKFKNMLDKDPFFHQYTYDVVAVVAVVAVVSVVSVVAVFAVVAVVVVVVVVVAVVAV